jgi:glucose 1-dehydrogenase
MKRFNGSVALVTGAGQGIGRGIAKWLAKEGAAIVVNDVVTDPKVGSPAIDVLREIENAYGTETLLCVADVSSRKQVERMFAMTMDRFSRIDIVVANASVSYRSPVVNAQWDAVLRTIEVTQFGVWHVCQAAAAQMSDQGYGKIVIVGSILSEIPFPTSAAYCMAKAGITHFARTLATELAPRHVNVNVVSPGHIDTPGERKYSSEDELAKIGRNIPWGRLGKPSDVAKAVAFLVSEDADYITGSVLVVDGGLRGGLRLTDRED